MQAPIENLTLTNVSWTPAAHTAKYRDGGFECDGPSGTYECWGAYVCSGWKGDKVESGLFATGTAADVSPPLPRNCSFLPAEHAGPAAPRALKTDEPPRDATFLEPVSGLPFLPAGYWSQDATPAFFSEFGQGLSFVLPMIGHAKNFSEADKWLTQMDIQGASVMYDLHGFTAFAKTYTGSKTNGTMNVNCSAHLIDSLRAEISRVAHHRSIAGWFLVDEPDGGSDKVDRSQQVDCLQRCADTIREVDARWKRPIGCSMRSAVGNMQGDYGPIWMDFEPIVDVLMPDIYPLQVHPTHCWECVQAISATLDHIRNSTSKPIWLIAQAFGGNENFVRSPSPFEERLMTYLAWIHGAT
eukprot:COSAG04_NODE_3110_length_3158_cov_208.366460_4_plen_355_part_00